MRRLIEAEIKRRSIWTPFPGPQTDALASPADELFYGGAAGGGKMLCLNTWIPTPSGWATIGNLHFGDTVFDERGVVCQVIATHPVDLTPESYRVKFNDGVVIDACADHLWLTYDAAELAALTRLDSAWRESRRARRASKVKGRKSAVFTAVISARNASRAYEMKASPRGTVRSTAEIAATLLTKTGRRNHAVQVTAPLELPDANLPIDPYVLGAWLGDGNSHQAPITCHDVEILNEIKRAGYIVSPRGEAGAFGINDGLIGRLRGLGLIANKHVPACYLRGSVAQRVALIQGMMDTDGNCNIAGSAEFTTTIPALRDGFHDLLMSLGVKGEPQEGRAKLNGRDCGPKWRFKFTAAFPAFRLTRKLERQNRSPRRTCAFRYVVSCDPIASKPMRCITVNSPSRLYLAGRSMVPTHNTDLLIGAAVTQHHRSVIFRREYAELKGARDRAEEILKGRGAFNGQKELWRLNDGRRLEFGAVQFVKSVTKWQGRAHDLKAYDEITSFTEYQFRFLKGWNRSARPGQRSRVIATGNPPTTAEGDWVISYWGPWLDRTHPNPALPGELRWFATIGGKDIEVADGTPFRVQGEADLVQPKSRSFIRARVQDNPVYMASGYVATLQALPEPLRSKMFLGDFSGGQEDAAGQVIPTAWVMAAQARWTPTPPAPITTIGVDVARGGDDRTVLTPRHANWFGEQKVYPGSATPDGKVVAQLCLAARPTGTNPLFQVDIGGVGSSPYDMMKLIGLNAVPMNSSNKSEATDRSGRLTFHNARAEWWWKLREALDPELGENLAIPPDRELLADLTAARWKLTARGILVEEKSEIIKRIHRSPDKGESLLYSFGTSKQAYDSSLGWV